MSGAAPPRTTSATAFAPPPARTAAAAFRGGARVPALLLAIVLSALLLPEELSFYVGTLRLTPTRAILLLLAPLILMRAGEQAFQPNFRFVRTDAIMPFACAWMFASVWITEGPNRALAGGGSTALEFAVAYYAARSFLTGPGQVMAVARLLAATIAVVGFLAVLDTTAGRFVVHDLFAQVTGYAKYWKPDHRFGLLRASSTLEHPIMLGTVCVFGVLLAHATLRGPAGVVVMAGCLTGLVLSFSSAPLMALGVAVAMLAYRRATPGLQGRWLLFGGAVGGVVLLVFLVHPLPFGFLFRLLTFDPATGWYRLLIWQFAGEVVLAHPIFGLGLTEDWPRPDFLAPSVDSMWLRAAMTFGIPGSALIALCLLGARSRRVDTDAPLNLTPQEKRLGRILSLCLFLYFYVGFTVYFWGTTWILMGFLAGLRAQIGAFGALPRPAAAGG
jgi:O-antigen ligase